MNVRNLASLTAAGFIGILLIAVAAQPARSEPARDVVVQALPNPDARTTNVNSKVSDIRSSAGQKTLIRLVSQATYEVCPDNGLSGSTQLRCIAEASHGPVPNRKSTGPSSVR